MEAVAKALHGLSPGITTASGNVGYRDAVLFQFSRKA